MKLVLFDDNNEEYSTYEEVSLRDDNGEEATTQGGVQYLAYDEGELLNDLTPDVFAIQWRR